MASSPERTALYVITSLSVGGAQKALLNLARSGFSQDYKPHVLALVAVDGLYRQFVAAGIPVTVLGINRVTGLLLALPRLVQVLLRVRPALIHGWMHHGNLAATLAWGLMAGRPLLLWGMHHTPEQATLERLQHALVLRMGRWLSRFPQSIVYVSQRSLQRHRELGYAMRHARVIANGIPAADVQANRKRLEDRLALRQELGLGDDALLIGSLTRLVPEKDIPNLFAAIRQWQAWGRDAHFVLAGEGMVPESSGLHCELANLPRPEQVHLLGVRADAAHLIAALDIATLSSRREAFPLFLAEAMAAGVPCVATDVGDIAECVADTGLVVPAGDPEALAGAWRDLLQQDNNQRASLGDKASRRIASRYSLDAVVVAYRELITLSGWRGSRFSSATGRD